MPPVHFENGQNAKTILKPTNAKNAIENEKKYNRATCLCVFRKRAKCQKRHKNEKVCDRTTCLCAFQKRAECQKRLKSTEIKKFHN